MSTITESELPKTVPEPNMDSNVRDSLLNQVDDGSSSSLSDPDDRTGNEDGDDAQDGEEDGSDVYDTEAETERLEKTPRKQRDVLLTLSDGAFPDGEDLVVGEEQREGLPMEEDPQQTSDSTLGESGDEDEAPQGSSSSRKRKRADYDVTNKGSRVTDNNLSENVSKPSRTPSLDESTGSPTPLGEDENQQPGVRGTEPMLKQSHKKGKRKGKKTKEDEALSKGERVSPQESPEEAADHGEAASSNGEDVEMEDTVERDGADADSTAKTEEDLAKKKTAMEALSAIENCFATLRDKLFDERLAQCNDELAMLEQPTFIHPELLLMKEVIDRRRNQKIKYEQTLLKYKLESLQRESIANKAQMHSQYMQTAGELRDAFLSQINAEIYQTQRERRSCEADMPDYMYAFTAKRSKQITEQTAYNEEVSLLSGIAKYAGFPAAPVIVKARSNEWEEDERTYKHNLAVRLPVKKDLFSDTYEKQVEDEASKARRPSQHHPPMLRASLSAASTFGRPPPAAEVQFLQQNAWANPQHPVHQKDRQGSTLSQAATPSATPANQKRLVESRGSASTIPEHLSAPDSSVVPTPATEEVSRDAHTGLNSVASQNTKDATPSRITGVSMEENPALNPRPVEDSLTAASVGAERNPTPLSSKIPGRESHTPGSLPKPLPFMQGGGMSQASPPIRNPVIKAEDPSNVYRHTPIAHQFQGTPPISTASNGQISRFSA